MKSCKLIVPVLIFTLLSATGCEKSSVNPDLNSLVTIKTPSVSSDSYTSVIATRKNATAEITLKYFDPAFFYKERNYTVYPDYYEVYLSTDEGASWELNRTVDTSYINKSFTISGLVNNKIYYVYLKEIYKRTRSTKNTNVAIFVPSSFQPIYNLILTNYYKNDLYSFDMNRSNNSIVYATTFYEFKPGYAAASLFYSRQVGEPELVDINAWFPQFNNDATKIIYSSDNGEIFDGKLRPEHISIYDLNSKSTARITSGYSVNRYPAWSPDNSRIAFSRSDQSDGSLRITLMDPVAQIQKVLQTSPGLSQDILSYSQIRPAWSADGSYIYFTMWFSKESNINPGFYDIYRISANGGVPEPVLNSPWTECTPSLSPDNNKLAFLANFNGSMQIWIYNFTDNSLHQPFDTEIYSFDAVWSQLKWKDNRTVLFSDGYGLYSVTVE